MITKLYSAARPLEGAHSTSPEKQATQRDRTGAPMPAMGDMNVLHARQCRNMSVSASAPSKKGALDSSGTGTGFADVAIEADMSGASLVRAEDRRGVERQDAAVAGDEDVIVLVDLALTGLAARLDHALRERREAPHVVRGQLAAARVARQRAARPQLAVGDEVAAFALRAVAVVLERDEDRVRVTVVQLEHVDVGQLDAGLTQGHRPRCGGTRVDARIAVAAPGVARRALAEAAQVDRRLAQIARALRRGHDHGDAAVGDQAAVEEVQRL